MNCFQNSISSQIETTSELLNYEVDYNKILQVIELIKYGLDDDFNLLFAKYFKLAYGKQTTDENLRVFTAFLIDNIYSFVNCSKNFPIDRKPTKKELKIARKVTEFEEEYSKILYFGQQDISEKIRKQIDRILAKVFGF